MSKFIFCALYLLMACFETNLKGLAKPYLLWVQKTVRYTPNSPVYWFRFMVLSYLNKAVTALLTCLSDKFSSSSSFFLPDFVRATSISFHHSIIMKIFMIINIHMKLILETFHKNQSCMTSRRPHFVFFFHIESRN